MGTKFLAMVILLVLVIVPDTADAKMPPRETGRQDDLRTMGEMLGLDPQIVQSARREVRISSTVSACGWALATLFFVAMVTRGGRCRPPAVEIAGIAALALSALGQTLRACFPDGIVMRILGGPWPW